MASWIEISDSLQLRNNMKVEAYVASWIEMNAALIKGIIFSVEAYVASWIEISSSTLTSLNPSSRGLCGLVD